MGRSLDLPEYARRLRRLVENSVPRLLALSDTATSASPGPGKWSPREILGHLIDSASNNHDRFVRAQFQDALVFPGYDQDAWVAAQEYQVAPWTELVGLWRGLNLHIARVMEAAPESKRAQSRAVHSLDKIAWKTVPLDQPTTLDYLMEDYVDHLEHHLGQLLVDGVTEED